MVTAPTPPLPYGGLPGGTGISRLRVHDWPAADGLGGGTRYEDVRRLRVQAPDAAGCGLRADGATSATGSGPAGPSRRGRPGRRPRGAAASCRPVG
ncbi:hypothetical protein EAO77_17815 [Streptomyces sp. t39]|nr:hypothetical protein EAO77_17815 [Streptomyces sp. t39]